MKPDTSRADAVGKGGKPGVRGVMVSLFFGLTIGFGTRFVGTGGGMMMLVVFTAFPGMELKTAVSQPCEEPYSGTCSGSCFDGAWRGMLVLKYWGVLSRER